MPLTPEEEAELAELEGGGLSPEEEAELAALESQKNYVEVVAPEGMYPKTAQALTARGYDPAAYQAALDAQSRISAAPFIGLAALGVGKKAVELAPIIKQKILTPDNIEKAKGIMKLIGYGSAGYLGAKKLFGGQ